MHNSAISRARRETARRKFKVMGDHDAFLARIKKSLYYGKLPNTERFSLPVSELAAELFSEIKNGKSLDRLDIEEAAALSRNACVSPCSLVLALLYLERLKTCNSEYLQRVGPSELFLVSMLIASKFLHDDGEEDEVFNDEWATSAGLDVKEVNRFEKEFLQAIGWEVFISEQAFWSRLQSLEQDVALREGKRRGWFSYSDLDHLLEIMDLSAVAQAVISVSAVCLTSYTASVLTLIGSAFIVSNIPGNSLSSNVSPLRGNETASLDLAHDSSSSLSSPLDAPADFLLSSVSSDSVPDCIISNDRLSASIQDLSPHDHNETSDTDYAHSNWLRNVPCPTSFSTNGSDTLGNTLKQNLNKADLMDELNHGEVKNESSVSIGLLEWLMLARTWLVDPPENTLGSYQASYWPIEIAASC